MNHFRTQTAKLTSAMSLISLAYLLLTVSVTAQTADKKPVKIFILASDEQVLENGIVGGAKMLTSQAPFPI